MNNNQIQNINYYPYNTNHNLQYGFQHPYPINTRAYSDPSYYQNHTYPYINNNLSNWEEIRNLSNVTYSNLFRRISDYAGINNFAGGFPTFRKEEGHSTGYEVILINSQYGVKDDLRDLDPSPSNFAVHIRNTDRALRNDPRYLGGFPNFHVSASEKLFGATRLFKNAGERRWVTDSELGIIGSESDENLMIRAQMYAERNGFTGGFPSFEHRSGYHELILLNNNAATRRIEYFQI